MTDIRKAGRGPADLILRGVCKSFGTHVVLKDLSLRFAGGEISCVMTPSGAGQTTLLRILMGLEKADAGTVEGLEGQRIGALFQEDRLLPWASAAGNIRLCNRALGEDELRAALSEVGLAGAEGQKAAELSGGMARRVALLRALLAENDLLLLDEPFKGLDEETKHLAVDALLRRRGGRTVVVVTHDAEEAKALGARIFTLPLLREEGAQA